MRQMHIPFIHGFGPQPFQSNDEEIEGIRKLNATQAKYALWLMSQKQLNDNLLVKFLGLIRSTILFPWSIAVMFLDLEHYWWPGSSHDVIARIVRERIEKGKKKWQLLLSKEQMRDVELLLESHESSLLYHQVPILPTMKGAKYAKVIHKAFVAALKQQVKK
jgi:hypothetical protein